MDIYQEFKFSSIGNDIDFTSASWTMDTLSISTDSITLGDSQTISLFETL